MEKLSNGIVYLQPIVSRSTSLLTFLPRGDEETLRTENEGILSLRKIWMIQTMVRLVTTDHERKTTKPQVLTLKTSDP